MPDHPAGHPPYTLIPESARILSMKFKSSVFNPPWLASAVPWQPHQSGAEDSRNGSEPRYPAGKQIKACHLDNDSPDSDCGQSVDKIRKIRLKRKV